MMNLEVFKVGESNDNVELGGNLVGESKFWLSSKPMPILAKIFKPKPTLAKVSHWC